MTLLASCAVPHRLDHSHLLHREFLAMGTRIAVSVRVDRNVDEARADAAIDAAKKLVSDFGQRWWSWGDGELAAINRDLANGQRARIPQSMQPLFARAWELHRASGGRFDPRVGGLVRLWGFDDVARLRTSPPAQRDITRALSALRRAPPYANGEPYGPARAIAWDFGAVAKGWIVDAALDTLRDAGFADALVDAGGNLAVRGSREGNRAWHVAIRDPRAQKTGRAFIAELDVRDESVNTHADDQRFFEKDGRRFGHILDPSTGWPVSGFTSVTVVHRDGALADAGGLAIFVAGPAHWRETARALGLDQVLVVLEDGRCIATAKLAQRLHAASGVAIETVPES